MGLTSKTIRVAKNIPKLIDQLISGHTVELIPDAVSLSWDSVNKRIELTNNQIIFAPPARLYVSYWGVTINTTLHYLTILDNGHTVVISIMGPDITLTLEVDDDGEDVGIVNPASLSDGQGVRKTSRPSS